MFFRLLPLLLLSCYSLFAKETALVSIEPLKFFVEQIAGTSVDIVVMVPPGASPHSFEPTAKQLIAASKTKIWFRIGEPFEKKAIEVLMSHNPDIKIVDTRKNISLLGTTCSACIDEGDTHIWLSPKRAMILSSTIKEALSELYPEHAPLYEANYQGLMQELTQLDRELSMAFQPCSGTFILVTHPAFGYLCKDYHINQLSIEMEGKDPTPKQLTALLQLAKKNHIQRILAQEQYSTKGAYLIANAINAKVSIVDPYSSDYLNNLRKIAHLICP